eukprot:3766491-Amphidinium_carterae.1
MRSNKCPTLSNAAPQLAKLPCEKQWRTTPQLKVDSFVDTDGKHNNKCVCVWSVRARNESLPSVVWRLVRDTLGTNSYQREEEILRVQ